MEIKEEAIVLKAIDFREHQKIVTLFSRDLGLISMIAKRVSIKNIQVHTLCTPLTRAAYILKKGSSDLFLLLDGHLIDPHLELRSDYQRLKGGIEIVQALLQHQFPGKSSPHLFQLAATYLSQLKTTLYPQALLASFYLKYLKHEGIFHEGLLPPHLDMLAHLTAFTQLTGDVGERDLVEVRALFQSTHEASSISSNEG